VRLITYIGLVARRVWAKRALLVGSFIGSALVIALLVVMPLYEGSIKAVDLRFSLQAAPSDEVELTAFFNTTSYSGALAAQNRRAVDEASRWVDEWYPASVERVQTREFVVIPVDRGVDWLGQAAAWREAYDALVAAGEAEDNLPAPPYPTPPREASQARFMSGPGIESRLTVIDGTWPAPLLGVPPDATTPLPVVLGEDLASTLGRAPGDQFVLRPFVGQPSVFELVEVVAIVQASDPTESFWGIDDPGSQIYLPLGTLDAWTAALPVEPEEDLWGRSFRGFLDTDVAQRWFFDFDRTSLDITELDDVQGSLDQFRAELARDSTIQTASFLPGLIDRFGVRSVVVGAPILAMLALVVGGALYFLVYTAALQLEREGPELALLRTRGASGWQTVGIHLAQSLLIASLAAAAAPFVARFLVALTGRVPPLSDLTGGEPLGVAQLQSIVPYLIAGAAVTFISMGLAILPFARRGVLELRSLAARPSQESVWQRYNLDLFAIAVSLIILFQLVQRGFLDTSGETVQLDPLAVVFPALVLFTGALVLLRILPWLLRLVGWAMTKARPLSAALPGWHLGRNPVPYGRLALLVWLTTGLGSFALTYANTLDASFQDRAEYAAGADLRIIGPAAGYYEFPDDVLATPVLRTDGAARQSNRSAEVLAVRPLGFATVTTWREDFGAADPGELLALLRPDGPPDTGVALPDSAMAVVVDGVVVPRTIAEEATLGDLAEDRGHRLLMKLIDGTGKIWTIAADRDFVDTAWRNVVMEVTSDAALDTRLAGDPVPPFTIHAMWVERSNARNGLVIDGGAILVDDIRVLTEDGEVSLDDAVAELTGVNGLTIGRDIPGSAAVTERYSEVPLGVERPSAADLARSPLNREGTVTRWNLPAARTSLNPIVPQVRAVPDDLNILMDREAASIAALNVGDTSSFTIGAQPLTGKVVGFVDEIPTMTDRRKEGRMLIDFDAFNTLLNGPAGWSFGGTPSRLVTPDELWVETDDTDFAIRRITGDLVEQPDTITIAGANADFSGRPVQVGLVAILFVGAVTGVVLALAGVIGYVLLAVARRAQEMGVLRALGFPRSGVAKTFAVEQMVVLGLGAVIGAIGGILLMWAMVPFLQLGETARELVPSVILDVNYVVIGIYVAVVGLLMVASVIWATRRVSVRRMSEVLREVER
jgi:hypothetical protein